MEGPFAVKKCLSFQTATWAWRTKEACLVMLTLLPFPSSNALVRVISLASAARVEGAGVVPQTGELHELFQG